MKYEINAINDRHLYLDGKFAKVSRVSKDGKTVELLVSIDKNVEQLIICKLGVNLPNKLIITKHI